MFQQEMFTDGSFKGARYIANGCFGSVYALPDDEWVVKYAKADGTLNYLEWCKAMQMAGKGMKGMPEIDVLVHIEPAVGHRRADGRYMVTMRRYSDARGILNTLNESFTFYADVKETCVKVGHEYIEELIDAFDEYCQEVFVRRNGCSMVDDLHRGNIMWDDRKNEFVVTDPSCSDYCTTNTVDFRLH